MRREFLSLALLAPALLAAEDAPAKLEGAALVEALQLRVKALEAEVRRLQALLQAAEAYRAADVEARSAERAVDALGRRMAEMAGGRTDCALELDGSWRCEGPK